MMRGLLVLSALYSFLLLPNLFAANFTLQILDPHELAVPGAIVEIFGPAFGSQPFSTVTNGEGQAKIEAQPPIAIRIKAPGFEPLNYIIGKDSDKQIYLRLVPAVIQNSVEVTVKAEPVLEGAIESNALTIDRSGARTVYDALDRLVPSAYVPSRGVLGHGLGISNSISLRGLGGSPTTQLLIVMDGRPEVMGLMGHPIPDFYSLTNVASIAVTAGPASVLYGNRAMGGAIEIKSPTPEPGFHTELSMSMGSYYTGQDRFTHGGQIERLRYRVAGGIEHTNGHRENSSFRNQDCAMQLSYDLAPAWTAAIEGQYGHFNVEDPGTIQAPTAGQWSRVGRGGYSASLQNRTERAWGSLRFFSSHGHHMLYDGFRSVDNNTGFRLIETFVPSTSLEFDVGGDVARYGGRARSIAIGYDYGDHHIGEGGGFARARWIVTQRLRVNSGFRYDHNSVFGGVSAAEFGASFRLPSDYAFSVAIAKGYRNPTIRELYLFPAPTPTLKPENLWNYQATFQLHPFSRLLAWLTGYYSDADNLIVTTGRFPNLKLENIGRTLNRGVEVNARWHLLRKFSMSSGYAFLSSTNLAPYVPENKLNYSLDMDLNYAFVSISGKTVGRTWANTAKTIRLSGYTDLGLKCTIPVGQHWTIFASVDNLLNRDYQEIAGYPMPGINAAGGLNIKF